MTRRGPVLGVALLLTALLGGCVQLPEDGPVREAESTADSSNEQASSIDAVPPAEGASATEIAKGFIDAMAAWPIQTGVAREFLSEEAAAAWNPEGGTITFTDAFPPQASGTLVTVQLTGAQRLDASGAWTGPVQGGRPELRLRMTVEDGEYRIADPPDALVVPSSWFAQRYRQVSLHFFDRTGRIMVPEPVFVPRGDQLASTLTARLLRGPVEELRGILRSYLPAGLDAGLSVPITEDGVAEVQLGGTFAEPDPDDLDKMLAQLGWTLRQVPEVTALRLIVEGEAVRLPDGGTEYSVTEGRRFDPAGADANPLLYGLLDDRLVYGEPESLTPAPGPLGEPGYRFRDVSLNLEATQAAAVSEAGTSVYLGPVRGEAAPREVTLVHEGGTDLLPPAWDFTDRLWLLDRTGEGAEVQVRERRRLRTLQVPGVSGQLVRSFLVSRDATRFAAVVRRPGGDQVRVGRIFVDDRGRIDRAGRTERIPVEGIAPGRIHDIAWTSPTSIAVLSPAQPGELYEVRTVAVDGAPTAAGPLSTSVSGRALGLVASPAQGSPAFVVTRDALVNVATGSTIPLPEGRLSSLGYVG